MTRRSDEAVSPVLDDFRTLVGELIEHVPAAMFALDGAGRVFQTNERFETLLDRPRAEFVGESLVDGLVADDERDAARVDLEAVRAGERDTITLTLGRGNGSRVVAECDVRRHGRSASSPWLVTVLRSHVDRDEDADRPFGARRYGVRVRADGTLDSDDPALQGVACHRALYRRDRPCDRCPAAEAVSTGRTVETSWFEGEDQVVVVRATPAGSDRVSLERAILSSSVAELVLRARIERRIELARLSPRERDVLAYLRLGRSLEEIASILAISHHTVKFHTANLLQKLGADSRVDLIRILG